MNLPTSPIVFLFFGLIALGLSGCGRTKEGAASPTPSIQQQRAARAAEVPKPIQERWDYLNRIRQGDAFDAIDRTLVNDQNQLGVVLSAQITPENTAALMKKAMEELAHRFPDEDMTLDAYAPTTPLRKLGTVHYSAQSGQITYQPAQ